MKSSMRHAIFASAFLLLTASTPLYAQADDALANMDFEAGAPGDLPPGWTLAGNALDSKVSAVTVSDHPQQGRQAAMITFTKGSQPGAPTTGSFLRRVDATPYRGQLVLFRAALHIDAPAETKIFPWVGAYNAEKLPIGVTQGTDHPTNDWAFYNLIIRVPQDAVQITLALSIAGSGKAYIDSAQLKTVTEKQVGFEAPRALTTRELNNLVSFAHLFGVVRFFHPSDQVAATDWDDFAIRGVRQVAGAPDARVLETDLRKLFAPVAPTVKIFGPGEKPSQAVVPKIANASLIQWHHSGVYLGDTSPKMYQSRREPVADQKLVAPYLVKMEDGVSASVPLMLYKDGNGTLPHITGKTLFSQATPPSLFVPSALDRNTRLADVILAWTVFQHFFPYFDRTQVDWEQQLKITLREAAEDTDQNSMGATLARLVATLHDGHGNVNYGTLFVMPVAWDWIEGKLVVTATDGKSDLRPGDVILTRDGVPIENAYQALLPQISAATPQWARTRSLEGLRDSRTSAPIVFTAEHADGTQFTISLKPGSAVGLPQAKKLDPISKLKDGIWYVDLSRFVSTDAEKAWNDLMSAKAIIFDMRGYPSPNAIQILPNLADRPLLSANGAMPETYFPDRKNVKLDPQPFWKLPLHVPKLPGKFVFLTGGGAISYAESIMGLVEREKLGEIVGETTAGTNGDINPFTIPGGFQIVWSGFQITKADGSPHMGVGIAPTIPASRTIAGMRAGRDDVLEKGIEVAERP